MHELLRAEHVAVRYQIAGEMREALRDASLTLHAGELAALMGDSGSGKTTFARAVLGILPQNAQVTAQELSWQGQDLLTLDEKGYRALRGRGMALVSQNAASAFNPVRRMGSQIREILVRMGTPGKDARADAIRILERVGIDEPLRRLRQYPHQLSGGMLQRVMIGMALACHPALLIADEPTASLDHDLREDILLLMRDMAKEQGSAVLLITHDPRAAAILCRRVIRVEEGCFRE